MTPHSCFRQRAATALACFRPLPARRIRRWLPPVATTGLFLKKGCLSNPRLVDGTSSAAPGRSDAHLFLGVGAHTGRWELSRLLNSIRPTTSPLTVAAAHQYGKLVVPTPSAHGGSLLSPCSRSIPSSSFTSVSCRTSSAAVFSEVVNGPVGGRRPPRKRSRRGGARASCRERTVPTVPRSALRPGAVRRRREIAERCVAVRLVSIGAQVREPRLC